MKKRGESRRPTLKDVAALAGVSPITVSRAIRDPSLVSASLRSRIASSIQQIDYTVDQNASALASSRTNVLAVMIPSITNAVFADVLRGAYDAVEDSHFQIQIANFRYSPEQEERMLRLFLSQKAAALILTGVDQTEAARALLRECGRPVVQIMDAAATPIDMAVGFSHFDAGRALAQRMLGLGYRRIGYIAARLDPRTLRRIAGYQDALAEIGVRDQTLIASTPASSSMALGRNLFRELHARRPDIDAVMANNDDLALGALFECQRSGLRVPDDIGVAGFNDLEAAAAVYPSLTTVSTPRYEIGRRAVEMAVAAIEGAPIPAKSIDLGFSVRIRESTRR
ncbi:LacI family DNA-binding transcriptional regulator [Terrarubrum flagellatum]|uniref:LacI family DNA-binding transcriptional regulator n=1 Tax=Terrirubrum flagellatum TaxID=2895980 RepID=UPI003145568D